MTELHAADILSGLLIAALITVLVARARTSRRTPEAGNGGSMDAEA